MAVGCSLGGFGLQNIMLISPALIPSTLTVVVQLLVEAGVCEWRLYGTLAAKTCLPDPFEWAKATVCTKMAKVVNDGMTVELRMVYPTSNKINCLKKVL